MKSYHHESAQQHVISARPYKETSVVLKLLQRPVTIYIIYVEKCY